MSCGFNNNIILNNKIKKKYKSSVLGLIEVPLYLEETIKGITIKIINVKQYNLQYQLNYNVNYLKNFNSSMAQDNSPAIDIFFNIKNYLEFLYNKLGKININNTSYIIALWNVDNLDNAFWTGSYMVFGNGKQEFKPLVSPDVVSHELTHGLIQTINNLEYKGHSGALNESFSDVVAVMFEFFLYDKYNNDENIYNNLLGKADWFIGEDITINRPSLRNFIEPNKQKQPQKINGKYYINPNNLIYDYGGVHINSGIINHLFYLLCLNNNYSDIFQLWYRVYKKMNNKSTFDDFKNIILREVPVVYYDKLKECLIKVGFNI